MVGKRVFVYRNRVRNMFAIRDLETGQVTAADEVWLRDATFAVSQTGRLQALREHRRVLHAGVIGTLVPPPAREPRCDMTVHYNPRRDDYFTDEDDHEVQKAKLVHLIHGKTYIPRERRWP